MPRPTSRPSSNRPSGARASSRSSPGNSEVDAREVLERWVAAMNVQDVETLEAMLDPEFTIDYPQSGERIRGFDAFRRQIEDYPVGLERDSVDTKATQIVEGD